MSTRKPDVFHRRSIVIPLIVFIAGSMIFPLASIESTITPTEPPRGYDREALFREPLIQVEVGYDQHVAARYGASLEFAVAEALAIHNTEWRQYRRERFVLREMRLINSGADRDATYVLSRFLMQTTESPQTIHVHLIGRPVEVYTRRGKSAARGLAFRGSDALLIHVTPNLSSTVLAYYLFHEIGHLWGTYDLPFPGGNSTFGSKSGGYSFDLDAGNLQILTASVGPAPRETQHRGPAAIERRLEAARRLTERPALRRRLQDIVLHEPSVMNQSYVQKKKVLLASAGKERRRVRRFLEELESNSMHRRAGTRMRQRIADHYWRANDLIARGDYAAAEREIRAIQSIDAGSNDVHLLVGAIEKKIRTRK